MQSNMQLCVREGKSNLWIREHFSYKAIILNITIHINFISIHKYFKVALKFVAIMNIAKIKNILLLLKHRREQIKFCLHFTGELLKCSHGVAIV